MGDDIFDEPESYQLIISASRIPDGAEVTKRTGRKPFILRRTITLFSCSGAADSVLPGKEKNTIAKASDGAVLLVDERGNIEACSADTELVWTVDEHTLRELLDGTPQ